MIVILDYGIGNVKSIYNILKKIGVQSKVSGDAADISDAEKLILPGVGHFDHCMNMFNGSGLREIVEERVFNNAVPVLGVCVGCQMLFDNSAEGNVPGLGWMKGQVIHFKRELLPEDYKVPHMGWTDIKLKDPGSALYANINDPRFYFVHSYHVEATDPNDVSAVAGYGYNFPASVEKENIIGVQFHPEKSHTFGMKLYANFAHNY